MVGGLGETMQDERLWTREELGNIYRSMGEFLEWEGGPKGHSSWNVWIQHSSWNVWIQRRHTGVQSTMGYRGTSLTRKRNPLGDYDPTEGLCLGSWVQGRS